MGSTMHTLSRLEMMLRRDRVIVLAGLARVAVLAWAYMFYLASDMNSTEMAMPQMQSWAAMDLILMYVMWAVMMVAMMVAMMVPSAAPMVLIFATVNRKRREERRPFVPTGVFLLGYLLVWSGFAALTTLTQWGLHTASLLSSTMGETTSSILGGTLLLIAGIFQWSPLKYACLTRCGSPLGFLMPEWREGRAGALVMGTRHGVFLPGLLLDTDGPPVRPGRDESAVDSRPGCLCAGGKGRALRSLGDPANRAAADRVGRLNDRGAAKLVPCCEKQRYNAQLVVSWSNHERRPATGSGHADLRDADLRHQLLGRSGPREATAVRS